MIQACLVIIGSLASGISAAFLFKYYNQYDPGMEMSTTMNSFYKLDSSYS